MRRSILHHVSCLLGFEALVDPSPDGGESGSSVPSVSLVRERDAFGSPVRCFTRSLFRWVVLVLFGSMIPYFRSVGGQDRWVDVVVLLEGDGYRVSMYAWLMRSYEEDAIGLWLVDSACSFFENIILYTNF